MSELTHIKEIIPKILKEAAKKQEERESDKTITDNRRMIDESG